MFEYHHQQLYAEQVAVADIIEQHGSPCYIYSRDLISQHYTAYARALDSRPHLIAYAVKANSNLAVLNVLAKLGAGFDIVSGGELERVLRAGGEAQKIVFSGVAKSNDDIRRALEVGIYCFNIESEAELERINTIAQQLGLIAPVSLRVNPNVDAQTHPYISTGLKENKFGVAIERASEIILNSTQQHKHIKWLGVDCHIGSQLTDTQPFLDALTLVLELVDALERHGLILQHLDLGGGLGVRYSDETPPSIDDYIRAIDKSLGQRQLKIILEPGRSIVATAGIFVTQVEYLKHNGDKHFAIVDGAMNDLIRPTLYQAWMDIKPVTPHHQGRNAHFDIVGPVCETGDFLGKERELNLKAGDLLAVFGAGAYGFVMSSNYNSRPRVAEIMVDGTQHHLIRRRESLEQLWDGEMPSID